jgi:hypothetical protein
VEDGKSLQHVERGAAEAAVEAKSVNLRVDRVHDVGVVQRRGGEDCGRQGRG